MPKPPRTSKDCPLCGKPVAADYTPFCSRGCKDRDLLKWLGEGYSIPGPPVESEQLPGGVDSEESGG